MAKREKILVLVDTSEADETLLKFVKVVARSSETREIHIFNSIRTLNIPDEVLKDFPDLRDKAFEDRRKKISESVENHLDKDLISLTQIHLQEGAPSKGILQFIEEHSIDLLMMGRHKDFHGGGVLSSRLARRATCSLFIVPQGAVSNPDHLLVPCDFSEYSRLAMETTIRLAKKYNSKKVVCQNVFTVPSSWQYSGKTYEEFAQIMKQNAQKNFQKFMKSIDTMGVNVEDVYSQDTNDNPVTDIIDYVKETKPGCVIIGAKGRTATAALFIGSKAELFIQENIDTPMLLVRPKGKNAGILDIIKDI